MLRKAIGMIWSKTPYFLRLRMIRATQEKFTVSVAAIITNERKEILILDHVLRPFSSWGIPGGFIEAGEQPEIAIRRELFEETGLELNRIKMIRVRTIKRHVEILFRGEARGKGEIKSREISDLGWFEIDKMPQQMSRAQKTLIEEVLSAEI
ncbi:MAG: hydrolase [Acidobacteria bacterium]|jgi:8-oxo-dGTP diphosphatase|nr:hydrolase [Acidobacteriota bacterium]